MVELEIDTCEKTIQDMYFEVPFYRISIVSQLSNHEIISLIFSHTGKWKDFLLYRTAIPLCNKIYTLVGWRM